MTNTYDTAADAIQAAELEAKNSATFYDFDGQNCGEVSDADCYGWDGVDRRCDCGNRRVQWLANQNPDGKWYSYASAY